MRSQDFVWLSALFSSQSWRPFLVVASKRRSKTTNSSSKSSWHNKKVLKIDSCSLGLLGCTYKFSLWITPKVFSALGVKVHPLHPLATPCAGGARTTPQTSDGRKHMEFTVSSGVIRQQVLSGLSAASYTRRNWGSRNTTMSSCSEAESQLGDVEEEIRSTDRQQEELSERSNAGTTVNGAVVSTVHLSRSRGSADTSTGSRTVEPTTVRDRGCRCRRSIRLVELSPIGPPQMSHNIW